MSLMSLALLGWSFTTSATWEAQGVAKKSKQLSGSFLLRIRWVSVLILCLSAYLLISFSCILWNSQLCAYPWSLFLGCRGKMPKEEISLRRSRSSWWMFIEWMGKYPRKISKNKFFWDNRVQFSSIQSLILSDSLWPHGLQHARFPVHCQLLESTQTHVHWVGDAIQPSHSLSSPSPPALNLSQHQGLFEWVSSSHQVAKVLEFQLQHQSFQWTPRTDLL